MPCEIKVLIELYGPIDTGVIIWITNIVGKIDCISFYLPSFDPRFDRHRAFLTFFRGARWLSGRVSDSGARGRGFETYRRRVVSLSKTLYSPKVLVNYPGSGGSVPT